MTEYIVAQSLAGDLAERRKRGPQLQQNYLFKLAALHHLTSIAQLFNCVSHCGMLASVGALYHHAPSPRHPCRIIILASQNLAVRAINAFIAR